MDKLFLVELSGGNIRHCELELPATDYELLDALDKLRLSEADKLYFDICDYYGYNYLAPFISDTLNLYELNALSRKLADLNPAQQTAFTGLLKMEVEKRDGDILVPKLIDLAYSVDCCHVVAEALNDAQLGRFYADNGFIPITENVPDSVYELLDFEALGRKARNEEGGVFVDRDTYGCFGYVVRHTDLMEAYKDMDLAPKKPSYTVLLELTKGWFHDSAYPNLTGQDTQYIPKTIEENGRTLTLQEIQWQTDNTATTDGYALGDRYTAIATYTGSATSSYVTGYTVTAEYTGTVSRIALNRVRYVAIFEGTPIQPALPVETDAGTPAFRWSYVLIPLGVVAVAGAGIGGALLLKHRKENADEEDAEE